MRSHRSACCCGCPDTDFDCDDDACGSYNCRGGGIFACGEGGDCPTTYAVLFTSPSFTVSCSNVSGTDCDPTIYTYGPVSMTGTVAQVVGHYPCTWGGSYNCGAGVKPLCYNLIGTFGQQIGGGAATLSCDDGGESVSLDLFGVFVQFRIYGTPTGGRNIVRCGIVPMIDGTYRHLDHDSGYYHSVESPAEGCGCRCIVAGGVGDNLDDDNTTTMANIWEGCSGQSVWHSSSNPSFYCKVH